MVHFWTNLRVKWNILKIFLQIFSKLQSKRQVQRQYGKKMVRVHIVEENNSSDDLPFYYSNNLTYFNFLHACIDPLNLSTTNLINPLPKFWIQVKLQIEKIRSCVVIVQYRLMVSTIAKVMQQSSFCNTQLTSNKKPNFGVIDRFTHSTLLSCKRARNLYIILSQLSIYPSFLPILNCVYIKN